MATTNSIRSSSRSRSATASRSRCALPIVRSSACAVASETLPADERNLAVRAAVGIYARVCGHRQPSSSTCANRYRPAPDWAAARVDAATVLRMMATLFRLEPDQSERLARVALSIGADVPFFLDPVPARVTGIGERIAPLEALRNLRWSSSLPPIEVSDCRSLWRSRAARLERARQPTPTSAQSPQAFVAATSSSTIWRVRNDPMARNRRLKANLKNWRARRLA